MHTGVRMLLLVAKYTPAFTFACNEHNHISVVLLFESRQRVGAILAPLFASEKILFVYIKIMSLH